ncbi:MAG TPA: hypothetical protein VLM42_10450 [Bryobacteraceae bacterium]|nr:hypothetical protein [Bryobacteraceae bacterium]
MAALLSRHFFQEAARVTGQRVRRGGFAEVFPLERVGDAYARMLSGKARFRVVLTTGQ